ncbi:MAG: DNA polymerase III subunit delta [Methylococcales symbiont of Hymedesmia sp. n. MRB-2018]|nr:MAG: DNA polymerase III subunit delta [Methylococcales symbiont of Hymedesmia sp. n. MRB-2018]KAF3983339.1 MAG: DNA polymerase III subunit delta [Methylococcales symbiont of Hymedesmia sp. n. MRB-2018]
MRLKAEQLEGSLKKLAALYLISGDEPLQLGEAADAVRKAAKSMGYSSREVLMVDSRFEWNALSIATDSLSLFSEKTFVDLRISTAKLGIEGSKALIHYCQRLPKDTLLLITMPKLDKAQLKTKWFQSVDKTGVVIQIWPLDGVNLLRWLKQRAQKRGLQIDSEGIKILAAKIEGNLLAAAQEIEVLYVLHGQSQIKKQDVEGAVADNSRFDVFKLTDCVLAGRINRAIKILNGLKAEGIAAPVVLWALSRETRLLMTIKIAIDKGQNKEAVLSQNRLWDKRKQLVSVAVSRIQQQQLKQMLLLAAKVDRQIKGQEKGDCWETLLAYCMLFYS